MEPIPITACSTDLECYVNIQMNNYPLWMLMLLEIGNQKWIAEVKFSYN